MLDRLSLSRPMCANFKYLDALPLHPKCKIYFLTQTCRWSTPLNEVGDQFLASFDFKFGERHSISALTALRNGGCESGMDQSKQKMTVASGNSHRLVPMAMRILVSNYQTSANSSI